MPAETQTGTALVHGIPNSGSAISVTGFASFLFDSASATQNFFLDENKDAGKADANLTAGNEFLEIELDFEPSGNTAGTNTRAAAAAVAVLPAPLAKITLANFKIAAFNGDCVYVGGGKIVLNQNGPAKMTGLKLRKYADSTQNTLLTTTVSG